MTQEEKAKAYDEALEKARKRVLIEPQDHTDAILKDIFPELRENENERIRKEMIDFLNQYKEDGLRGVDITPWIVYLEKQKEQKPVEWNSVKINGKPIPTENQSVDISLVNWSEEDADMLNSCISSIEEAKENRYVYMEPDGDTSYDHEISWLKSLRP